MQTDEDENKGSVLIDGGEEFVEASEVTAYLAYYFRFDGEADGDSAFGLSTTPAAKQSTYNDISSNKNLVGKLAGNDAKTDHKVWTDGSSFVGWTEGTTPEGLIDAWFGMVADNAVGRSAGNFRYGLDGYGEALTDPLPVHVSEAGHDLQQLVQKFLMGALCFSQGADDYMDDDTEGKGLLASNAQDEDSTYSPLAHAWDEGFGYFGAARDYADYLDKEIAGKCSEEDACERGKYFDTDGDGAIDLKSEYNFGASQNAAKRDHGSAGGDDPTDISKEALDGFLTGRAIINAAGETLNQGQMMSLKAARDHAIGGWEKALAATVVHYINDTLGDMDKFGTDDYSFTTHAKHWSEMKGFAFAFQFNPKSPLSDEDFAAVHAAFGTGPVLSNASDEEISAYKDGLISARNLLRDAYGFSEVNASTW